MRLTRTLVAATVAAVLVPLGAGPALAAPPANDTYAGATPATLGFSETLDTTEATTDADDEAVNAMCGAPATDASVWYSFTSATDGTVAVDVSHSSYPAGVIVATGSPGSFDSVTCGPGLVQFGAVAGTTYSVLAFDYATGAGGTLAISFEEPPPPPTIEMTIDQEGSFDASGAALISGTYRCANAQFVSLFGELRQPVGRFVVSGFASIAPASVCDGAEHPWSAVVSPTNGQFRGGKATAVINGFACGVPPSPCAATVAEGEVQLRGGGW